MKVLIKILSFLLGCFIIFIIVMSSNSQWFTKLCSYLPSYPYGDLYLFSSMPGYQIPLNKYNISTDDTTKTNVALTILGDSYMRTYDSSSFCAKQFQFVHWDNAPDTIPELDKSKINILIIETTERYCRFRFKILNPIVIGEKQIKKEDVAEIKLSIEDNLQALITNKDFVMPLKELKSYMYLKCFDRFDVRVAKPDESGRLYLDETVNPELSSSCYYSVGEFEVNELVGNINILQNEARKMGFDRIYFSIIPNSASIYKLSELPYNNIIEKIQNNPKLKVPFIDAYHILKKQSNPVFYCNDSHWNSFGQRIWLTYTNELLKVAKK